MLFLKWINFGHFFCLIFTSGFWLCSWLYSSCCRSVTSTNQQERYAFLWWWIFYENCFPLDPSVHFISFSNMVNAVGFIQLGNKKDFALNFLVSSHNCRVIIFLLLTIIVGLSIDISMWAALLIYWSQRWKGEKKKSEIRFQCSP